MNASGVVFPSQCDAVPLCPEVAIAWTGAVSTWSQMDSHHGPDVRHGSRAERALRAQIKSLAGCSVRMTSNWPSAIIAASLAANGKVLVPRVAARDVGAAGALPDLLRAANIQVVEFGSVAGAGGYSHFDSHLDGAAVVLWSDDPQLLGMFEATAATSMLKIVIARHAWPRDLHGSGETKWKTWQSLFDAGADLVVAPTNELLGGPVGGLVMGDESKLSSLDRHPLWPVLCADRAAQAACCTAIELWLSGHAAQRLMPLNVIQSSIDNVRHRANQLAIRLGALESVTCETVDAETRIWPDSGPTLPSVRLRLSKKEVSGEAWAKRLAQQVPLVWCDYDEHAIMLDVRTIEPAGEAALLAALGGCEMAGGDELAASVDLAAGTSEPSEATLGP